MRRRTTASKVTVASGTAFCAAVKTAARSPVDGMVGSSVIDEASTSISTLVSKPCAEPGTSGDGGGGGEGSGEGGRGGGGEGGGGLGGGGEGEGGGGLGGSAGLPVSHGQTRCWLFICFSHANSSCPLPG